jgi:hypothetical protein
LDAVSLGRYLTENGIVCPADGEFVLDVFLARRLIEDGLLPKFDKHTRLDLSIFGEITPEALHYLSGFECENVQLGIHQLDIVAAKFLSGWKTQGMSIDGDVEFIPSSLLEFDRFAGSLYLGRIDCLDRDTAEALAKIGGDLSFSTPSISVPVAAALARHRGGLYVKGLEQLDVEALSELVCHCGDRLTLMLDCEPELDCIRAITSNPDKRVFRFKGDVYEALNSRWAVMVCSMDRCAEFARSYRMTEADIVSVEALVDEIRMDPLSISGIGN